MTLRELKEKINQIDRAIANYEELDSDLYNPEYIARGNGFCDSKYSEDFIEGQIEKLKLERLETLKNIEALEALETLEALESLETLETLETLESL